MNIAIWGLGKFGKYIYRMLNNSQQHTVKCFIDKNADSCRKYRGIDVYTPDEFKGRWNNDVEAVLIAFIGSGEVRNYLMPYAGEGRHIGIVQARVFTKQLGLQDDLRQDANIIWENSGTFEKPWLETLETNVVDFCNLNCKGCSHFSNIFPKGHKIPYEIFEKDIKQIAKSIFIEQFNLLGGEVFLCDNLADYFACIAENMPQTKIELVSNGLLIPRVGEEIWRVIQKYNVAISVTEYLPFSKIKEDAVKVLRDHKIPYELRPKVETFGKNVDLSGKNDPYLAQSRCRESNCQFLRNGRIYKCPFSALGNYYFDHYRINLHFDEGFDIYAGDADWFSFAENVRKEPIKQCQYCGGEARFDWAVSNCPQKEEWLI